jgi:hypothetical protein
MYTKMSKEKEKEECVELKNIKYKTMLQHHSSRAVPYREQVTDLDEILKKDKAVTQNLPWNKLEKRVKKAKLIAYAGIYCETNHISDEGGETLKKYLGDMLDKKHLQRAKEVAYNKSTGLINNIPNLSFNKNTKKFAIKNTDKKISPMASLAPKNNKKTMKKKSPRNRTPKSRKSPAPPSLVDTKESEN